jgi:hypothetical protein
MSVFIYFGPKDNDSLGFFIDCYSDRYTFNFCENNTEVPVISFVDEIFIHGHCFLTTPPYRFEFTEEGIKLDKKLTIIGDNPHEIK